MASLPLCIQEAVGSASAAASRSAASRVGSSWAVLSWEEVRAWPGTTWYLRICGAGGRGGAGGGGEREGGRRRGVGRAGGGTAAPTMRHPLTACSSSGCASSWAGVTSSASRAVAKASSVGANTVACRLRSDRAGARPAACRRRRRRRGGEAGSGGGEQGSRAGERCRGAEQAKQPLLPPRSPGRRRAGWRSCLRPGPPRPRSGTRRG